MQFVITRRERWSAAPSQELSEEVSNFEEVGIGAAEVVLASRNVRIQSSFEAFESPVDSLEPFVDPFEPFVDLVEPFGVLVLHSNDVVDFLVQLEHVCARANGVLRELVVGHGSHSTDPPFTANPWSGRW